MKNQKTMEKSLGKKRKLFEDVLAKYGSGVDPSYKLFLENLKLDGDTYVLDVPNEGHDKPVSVRYEVDDGRDKNTTDFPNSSLSRSCGAPEGKQQGEASGRAPSGNVDHSVSPWTSSAKRNMKISEMDESYERFLSLVKFKDGFMVIEPEPGVTIVYEQEEGMPARYGELRAGSSTNKSKPLISPTVKMEEIDMHAKEDRLAQAENTASEYDKAGPSSKDLDGQDKCGHLLQTKSSELNACKDDQRAQLCSGSSTFDKKLSAILNQPYDQNEYEELWRKATDRKPVTKQRHLRSASKLYATNAIGLSYLDHHPDLAEQLDSADRYERLSLLRKFFFWLENLCHEGAYMPWISKPLHYDPISPDESELAPRSEQ